MALSFALREQTAHNCLRPRLTLAMWLLTAAMFALLWRLYSLQVLRGEELLGKGRRNFVQNLTIPHDRGMIYDRHGVVLVDNRPSLDLLLTPAFLGKTPVAAKSLQHLAAILALSNDEQQTIINRVAHTTGLARFRPIIIRRDLNLEQVEAIEAERSIFLLDGIEIGQGRRRNYRYGAVAAHVLGYVNEIDSSALENERLRGNPFRYDLGDMIGREGIERVYEEALRGIDGRSYTIVDVKGRRQDSRVINTFLGDTHQLEPHPGHNIYLTLDIRLQERAEQIFRLYGKAGCVIVLNPYDGAILALVSIPAFDVNQVGSLLSKKIRFELEQNLLKPWLNRAIAGQYVPGSTFKVVTALAGLKHHIIHHNESISCPGTFHMGRHVWRCWKDDGHGPLNLLSALQRSCNIFFYTIGQRLGIDLIAEMARHLGFGKRTGIPLFGEMPGLVPDEAFHQQSDSMTGGYQRGMSINTAIGQGALMVTPLQLAVAYAAIANGKEVLKPQLALRIESADYRMIRRNLDSNQVAVLDQDQGPHLVRKIAPMVQQSLAIDSNHLELIRQGLYAASNLPGGTGFAYRSKTASLAGKTGTAQVVRLSRGRNKLLSRENERDHAWFVGYAPAEAPEIVVAVLNEHAGHAGSAAAPIAAAVIDAFFALKNKPLAKP